LSIVHKTLVNANIEAKMYQTVKNLDAIMKRNNFLLKKLNLRIFKIDKLNYVKVLKKIISIFTEN